MEKLRKGDVAEVIQGFIEKYWNVSSAVELPKWEWKIEAITHVKVPIESLTEVSQEDEFSLWTFKAEAQITYSDGVTDISVIAKHFLIGNATIKSYLNLHDNEYLPEVEPKLVITRIERTKG